VTETLVFSHDCIVSRRVLIFFRFISSELGLALPWDMPPWLSESIAVITGACFSHILAKSNPKFGAFICTASAKKIHSSDTHYHEHSDVVAKKKRKMATTAGTTSPQANTVAKTLTITFTDTTPPPTTPAGTTPPQAGTAANTHTHTSIFADITPRPRH